VRSKGGARQGPRFSRRTLIAAAAVLAVAIGLGIGLPLALSSSGNSHAASAKLAPLSTLGRLVSPGPLGPQGPEVPPLETGPNLAPAGSPSPGQSVDGIQCQGGEQVAFHIHARLTIFVDGKAEKVPYGVGIADPQIQPGIGVPFVASGACFSWLHTHAADGIVHIESPVRRTYTLGDFFDVWHEPLGPRRLGPLAGRVIALVDGRVYRGNPRRIPLLAHAQIQLELGRPLVAPEHISFPKGL
jgi:hypothetical protein